MAYSNDVLERRCNSAVLDGVEENLPPLINTYFAQNHGPDGYNHEYLYPEAFSFHIFQLADLRKDTQLELESLRQIRSDCIAASGGGESGAESTAGARPTTPIELGSSPVMSESSESSSIGSVIVVAQPATTPVDLSESSGHQLRSNSVRKLVISPKKKRVRRT